MRDDRRPLKFGNRWLWHPQPADAPDEDQFDYLPPDVFAALTGFLPRENPRVSQMVKAYQTREEAMAALYVARRTVALLAPSPPMPPGPWDAPDIDHGRRNA